MAVTGKQVFDITMNLIDEVSETGSIALDSPAYYETRSKAILSILQSELLPITETPQILTSLDTELVIDDRLAIQILPYGLAAHLLMQEDMSIAAYYNARYDELKRKIPTKQEAIIDVYGVSDEVM